MEIRIYQDIFSHMNMVNGMNTEEDEVVYQKIKWN